VHLKIGTLEDVTQTVRLLEALFSSSIYSKVTKYRPDDVATTIRSIITGGTKRGCLILLMEEQTIVGALLTAVVPLTFNHSAKNATELAFYIRPEYRTLSSMRMVLSAYRYWAKQAGCQTIMMGKITSADEAETYTVRKIQ
jgi:hypothetical protein